MSVMHTLISSRAMALAELYQDTPTWPAGTTFTDNDITGPPPSFGPDGSIAGTV